MEYYKPTVLQDFGGGWNPKWALNAAQLQVNQSPYMVNADYAARFAITKRRGTSLVGNATSGAGGCSSLWNFTKMNGTEILMRAHTTVLQYLSAGTWTDLQTGLSSGAKFDSVVIGDTVYYGNAVNDFAYWTGTGAATTNAGLPKGNIYAQAFFRLWIAGITANPNRLSYSDVNAYTTFSSSEDFPSKIKSIKNFFTRDGVETLLVFLENGYLYDVGFDTGGIYKRLVRIGVGSLSHRATKQLQNYNFVVDIFKSVSAVGYEEGTQDIRATSRSSFIEDYLDTLTLSSSAAIYSKRNYVLAAQDPNGSTNNVELVYHEIYDSWRLYSGHAAADYTIYQGKVTFASATDLNVYQYDSEKYSDNDVPIYFRYDTRGIDLEDPIRDKVCRYVKIAGFISTGCNITVKSIADGRFSSPLSTKTISGNGAYVDPTVAYPFGSAEYGAIPFAGLGGTSSTIEVRPFWVAMMLPEKKFDDLRLSFTNYQKDVDFIITHIKPVMAMAADDHIPVVNQI